MHADEEPAHADVFTALGDPLIRGLTEVANTKPRDPVAFLAAFLHNFPDKDEKSLGTQETKVLMMNEAAEVESEQPPPAPRAAPLVAPLAAPPVAPLAAPPVAPRQHTATLRPSPIDVVAVEPRAPPADEGPEAAAGSANRDEHGQSMLHFAAARAHSRGALLQLLSEAGGAAQRDELYRTARDVALQANVAENMREIDRWVVTLAARDNIEEITSLLLDGYDHIVDATDEDGVPITEVVRARGLTDMAALLESIPAFEESRERLHSAVRRGDAEAARRALAAGGRPLARARNTFGRSALHVAVLAQHEELVLHLATEHPELLRLGDNLERTPLHYAMGVDKLESLSRILIKAGARRVLKDLKGRQPSYYFMNKSDILRLKEEEEVH